MFCPVCEKRYTQCAAEETTLDGWPSVNSLLTSSLEGMQGRRGSDTQHLHFLHVHVAGCLCFWYPDVMTSAWTFKPCATDLKNQKCDLGCASLLLLCCCSAMPSTVQQQNICSSLVSVDLQSIRSVHLL